MSGHKGSGPSRPIPRTERADAPAYLQRHQQRRAAAAASAAPAEALDGSDHVETPEPHVDRTGETPLYLRRFRERQVSEPHGLDAPLPSFAGQDLGTSRAWAEVTRTKEIIPERREQLADVDCDVYLIRHGETQGYSSESGLTPLGAWQAHRRGQELARRVMDGHSVELVCAPTNRARQTAEHVRRGLLDNIEMFARKNTEVGELRDDANFRNFAVATPEGLRDVTSAFRIYHREMEKYERIGLGERPGWLVEVDRFWGIQQGGGDPITQWLTMPMLYFEPPVTAVRRFWRGIVELRRNVGARHLVIATHSGPIRAFATTVMGYDPGEPFNTEFVRIRLIKDGPTAIVLYRNRVQEFHIPDLDALPDTMDPRFSGQLETADFANEEVPA
ncbi:MAG: histidine phosphatase family protein [Nocardioides sp.]